MIAAGPDLTPGFSEGWLRSVAESEGVGLVGDHPAGATVLAVSSLRFADTGDLTIAGVTYAYTRGDETLTINPGLASAQESGASVIDLVAEEPSSALVARVDLDMDGDPDNDVTATIAGELAGFYTVGDYPPGVLVTVADTPTGYEVKGRPTDAPKIDPDAILTPSIHLRLPAALPISNGTWTPLTGWAIDWAAGFFAPASDGFVRLHRSGIWRVEAFVQWEPTSSSGSRALRVERLDFGSVISDMREPIYIGPAETGYATSQLSESYLEPGGHWIRISVRQSSGASLAVRPDATKFKITWEAAA